MKCNIPECALRNGTPCPCWERQLESMRAGRLAASPVEIKRYRQIANIALTAFFVLSGAWVALTCVDALPWHRGLMGHLSVVSFVVWIVSGRN